MSNMTKTIAILGVVAGLGVAALPLSTYAADHDAVNWSPTGGATTDPATATENYGTFENKNWVKTPTTINLTVPDALSIDSTADSVSLTGGDANGQYKTATPVSVHVVSRNNAGYTLSMIGTGTGSPKTDLVNGTFKIATGAIADITAFKPATDASVWGYRIEEAAGKATATAENSYLAVAAATSDASAVIANETAAADVTYKIGFGAGVAAGQASGDYTGQVTFIATNN